MCIDQNANPIEYLIKCVEEHNILPEFVINNAKDELKRLKKEKSPAAWGRVNRQGDLYDLRLQNNPYQDQSVVVPLYR